MKKVDFDWLLKNGVIQEINRQLLHARGLALTLSFDDDGKPLEMYITESDSHDGIHFADGVITEKKYRSFTQLMNNKCGPRLKKLKYITQPLPPMVVKNVYCVVLDALHSKEEFATNLEQIDPEATFQVIHNKILVSSLEEFIPNIARIPGVISVELDK